MNFSAWLQTENGERITGHRATVKTEYKENLYAVFVNGVAPTGLDPECGAGIVVSFTEPIRRFCCDYRHSEFWCRPFFGTDMREVPDETQALLYEKEDGIFGVLLPVVNDKYKCVLCGGEQLTAKLFSWYKGLNRCEGLAFVGGEGDDPFALLQECTRYALTLLGTGTPDRTNRTYPEIFEYLGWCSWDSMQIRVNEDGVKQKCEEFKEKDIPVKWAILDDMWAEVHTFYDAQYDDFSEMVRLMHSSPLYSFSADPKRFPHGLKATIATISSYGMRTGMWHPTTGYWYGLDPDGPAFAAQKENLYRTADGRWIHSWKKKEAFAFYDAFHTYLQQCGAYFLKIDNQSMTRRFYKNCAPVGEVARNFHTAMEASVGAHFGGRLINCMGMAGEDMWNRPSSAISRCSDDFLPENKAWFTKHILQCAYNSLVQGQFLWCDWDMWWTDDGQAVKNSVLRAISGGPIYVSDQIGRSIKKILEPLTLSDGRILRCDRPAWPTKDCLTVDPQKSGTVFKLQNAAGNSGVLAVFNLNDTTVTGTLRPTDVTELQGCSATRFGVYEHFTGAFTVLNKDEALPLTLSPEDFALYTIVPLKDGFAPLGLQGKFILPKTITYQAGKEVALAESGTYLYIEGETLYEKPYRCPTEQA